LTIEMINHYACDLCREERSESELFSLYGPPAEQLVTRIPGQRVDICAGCTIRPVADVLALIEERKSQTGPSETGQPVSQKIRVQEAGRELRDSARAAR
jgi:hypothetical protein